MQPWAALAEVSRGQRGLVTLRQAVGLGLDERTVQRHVLRYGWERVHRGVYAHPGSSRTFDRDVAAALLAAGPRSAASHATAAAILGLHRSQPRPLDLVVPMDRKAPALRGVRSHRSRTLLSADVVQVDRLRVTCAARTLCDLATQKPARLRELTAVALQSGLTTIERVRSTSHRLGRHPGAPALADILRQLEGSSSDSGFERRARAWLAGEGLPPHPCPFPVRAEDDVVCELDIAYPEEMVYVDCRGFRFHSLPSALSRDDVRANGIVAAGWLHLALDEVQLTERSPRFLRQLRVLLLDRQGFAQQWGQRRGRPEAALPPRPRPWR